MKPEPASTQNSVGAYECASMADHSEPCASHDWSGPTLSPAALARAPLTLVPPALGRGSRGPAVKELQDLLMRAGYPVGPGGADGVFGRNTENAVAAFMGKLGRLASSCTMDADASRELRAEAAKAPPLPIAKGDFSHRTADGMPMLRQSDTAWAWSQLGLPRIDGSLGYITSAGCTLTSLTMIVCQALKRDVSPKEVNDALVKHGAFDTTSIHDWNKVSVALQKEFGLKLTPERHDKVTGTVVAQLADESLAKGRPLIIGIKYNGAGENPGHYLVVQRKETTAEGKTDYVVLDPSTGSEVRYGLDGQGNFVNRVPDPDKRVRVATDVTLLAP